MADQDNVATVKALYGAFRDANVPAMLSALDPRVEWHAPEVLPWGGTYHGPAGVGEFAAKLLTFVDGGDVEPEEYIGEGDRVVALGHFRGRTRTSGRAFDARFAHVYAMRDGKVARMDTYLDTGVVLRALEGRPGP